MRKYILLVVVFAMSAHLSFSQEADHVDGGDFEKKIEFNNSNSIQKKSILDKVLFGMTNSFVEYVSPWDNGGATGLCIVKDDKKDSYMLQVFRLPDSQKIVELLQKNTTETVLPDTMRADGVFGFHVSQMVNERNKRIALANSRGTTYKQFSVEPKSFRISEEFAAKLHNKMMVLIRDFRAERMEQLGDREIIGVVGGDKAVFRCIVGDELWTLNIHILQKRAKQLSSLCNQIITDAAGSKKFDEAKYMKLLDAIDL